MRMRIARDELATIRQATDNGYTEYDTGKKKIDQVINGVTNGKIGGSVSAELLNVYDTIKPVLEEAYKFFGNCVELLIRAEKEYDVTTEETSAALKSHRI